MILSGKEIEKQLGRSIIISPFDSEQLGPIKQFVQPFDDWENRICKARPKEEVMKYENGDSVIEVH